MAARLPAKTKVRKRTEKGDVLCRRRCCLASPSVIKRPPSIMGQDVSRSFLRSSSLRKGTELNTRNRIWDDTIPGSTTESRVYHACALTHGSVAAALEKPSTCTTSEGTSASPGAPAYRTNTFSPRQVRQACSPCGPKGVCTGSALSAARAFGQDPQAGSPRTCCRVGFPPALHLQEVLLCSQCDISLAGLKAASANRSNRSNRRPERERRQERRQRCQPQTPPAGTRGEKLLPTATADVSGGVSAVWAQLRSWKRTEQQEAAASRYR